MPPQRKHRTDEMHTIVIVGGVAGGASAATRARRCNEHARIIMYEMGSYVSFANCGLPYYLGEEIKERDKLIVASPELFTARFNIEVQTRHEVMKIDRQAKEVHVEHRDSGERTIQPYTKLILAPGATPIVPPLQGSDSANVFTLRNLGDADAIKTYLETNLIKSAVVVGAGFIGLEMVEQLSNLGIHVAVVELAPQILTPLDPEMASIIQTSLEQHSVDVRTGSGLEGFLTQGGQVSGVKLSGGETLEAQMVILGMGVRPATALAEEAGLEIGPSGGIAINEFAQTSDPDIYAAGDAVEYANTFLGEPMRVPLAGPANRAGRIAGEHAAAGKAHPMQKVLGTAILRVFDKTAGTTGLTIKLAERLHIPARATIITAMHHAAYYPGAQMMVLKLVYDPENGRVLGAQAVGGEGVDKRIDVIATTIHFGGTVYDLCGVDLSYAPPFGSAKDPVHMAAFSACNDLDGLTHLFGVDEDLSGKQVVDVRTTEEVQRLRLPYAVHIPVDELRRRLGELDPSKPTVVVCQSGLRGHVATRILRQRGFKAVKNLTGGMTMRQYAKPEDVIRGA